MERLIAVCSVSEIDTFLSWFFFRPFVNSDFFGGKTQYDYFKLLIKGTELVWLVVI